MLDTPSDRVCFRGNLLDRRQREIIVCGSLEDAAFVRRCLYACPLVLLLFKLLELLGVEHIEVIVEHSQRVDVSLGMCCNNYFMGGFITYTC